MPETLFQRVVVPVANREDARTTMKALRSYMRTTAGHVIAVHVIEKAGGAPDKASVEQRELRAEDIFAIAREGLASTDASLETKILYGTDIAATIIDAAHDVDASAIVFTPRGSGRWMKLLTGDVTTHLINDSDLSVIVLPDSSEESNS